MKKWTKDEELNLIDLLKNGNTYKQIGLLLDRSYKSIKEKLNKLGYCQDDFSEVCFYENKKCLTCEKEFKSLKSEDRIYCSQSCSATDTNSKRIKLNIKRVDCKYCGEKFSKNKRNSIYCSKKCLIDFRNVKKSESVELGIVKNMKILKDYLKRKDGCSCKICKMDKWNDLDIPLVLDHIDGNPYNNFPDNLRLICPNCDAQTSTYKGKNKGNGRKERLKRYYDDKVFFENIKK